MFVGQLATLAASARNFFANHLLNLELCSVTERRINQSTKKTFETVYKNLNRSPLSLVIGGNFMLLLGGTKSRSISQDTISSLLLSVILLMNILSFLMKTLSNDL